MMLGAARARLDEQILDVAASARFADPVNSRGADAAFLTGWSINSISRASHMTVETMRAPIRGTTPAIPSRVPTSRAPGPAASDVASWRSGRSDSDLLKRNQ